MFVITSLLYISVVPCLIFEDLSFKHTAVLLNLCILLLFCDHRFQRVFFPLSVFVTFSSEFSL